ncbi:DUF962 domain-containing protein [Jiella endophytica]|uniref:DUF962 domain-containing protein n=1 Tax=Jiella endophytica TaxID=2558362 RepID=A0A4Y8RHV8_9HYPH|nr:DUF962 domain-containing protein [Jiella endophytica]TFF22061.1 DUF962 domain-containing protein [Jiella endophytica]
MADRITTYPAFWHHYLREHASEQTRILHYTGTAMALCLLVIALLAGRPWLILAAIVCGYLFAWIGHMAIEKNRPATFTYPLWSLLSDFRMFFLWISGRLGPHLKAAGVSSGPGHRIDEAR